jgi:hypothetical protein
MRVKDVQYSDSKKDTQDKDKMFLLNNEGLRTNPFGQNISAENIYLRSERIAAAVFLLTSHIGHDEPLRSDVRSAGVHLVQNTIALAGELRASGSERVRDAHMSIREMISLVRFLGVAGYASAANVQLLVGALDELGQALVASERSALAEDVALRKEDLMPRTARAPQNRGALRGGPRSNRTQKRTRTVRPEGAIKDVETRGNVSNGLRSERIIDILRAGGILGIKDIATNLPEYSEKMIQRELSVLVSDNRVRKIGLKRWSKYQATA